MALETASYVANLVASNPDGGDQLSTVDDHLRLLKAVLLRTFPKMDGAVSLSAAQISYLGDLSASVQLQLNALRDGSATANAAIYANSASFAVQAGFAQSASYAVRASRAESASYAALAGTAAAASFATSAGYAASAGFATAAASATNATNAVNAQTAATASSANNASNAAALAGLAPSENAAGSTVVIRTSSGYIFSVYLNQSSAEGEGGTITSFATFQGDNYIRKSRPDQVGAQLSCQNISGRTGVAKTLSSSAPSGGSNGDIHYQY